MIFVPDYYDKRLLSVGTYAVLTQTHFGWTLIHLDPCGYLDVGSTNGG